MARDTWWSGGTRWGEHANSYIRPMKKFKVRLIVDKTYEVKAKSAFDAEHEAWHWLSFDINEKGRAEVEEVNEEEE